MVIVCQFELPCKGILFNLDLSGKLNFNKMSIFHTYFNSFVT